MPSTASRLLWGSVLVAACGGKPGPCPPEQERLEPPESLAHLVPDLPVGENLLYCGGAEQPRSRDPSLHLAAVEGSSMELFEVLRAWFAEQGFTEDGLVIPPDYGSPGSAKFRSEELMVYTMVLGRDAYLVDRSGMLALERRHAAADVELGSAAEAVRAWLPGLVEQAGALTGDQVCPDDLVMATVSGVSTPVLDVKALEALVASKGERAALVRIEPRFAVPCNPMASFRVSKASPVMGANPGVVCSELLLAEGSLPVLIWKESDYREPQVRWSGDGQGSFESGTFEGRVVFWNASQGEVSCHGRVSALSSRQVQTLGSGMEAGTLRTDLDENIQRTTRVVVERIAPGLVETMRWPPASTEALYEP